VLFHIYSPRIGAFDVLVPDTSLKEYLFYTPRHLKRTVLCSKNDYVVSDEHGDIYCVRNTAFHIIYKGTFDVPLVGIILFYKVKIIYLMIEDKCKFRYEISDKYLKYGESVSRKGCIYQI